MIVNGKRMSMKDCLVKTSGEYVWIGYSKEPPFLPVAVASSASELAKIMGVKKNTVERSWSDFRHGRAKRTLYASVRIEE